MQEEEYTFVTLDGNDVMPADAVIIDVEGGGVDLGDAIVIDDSSIESFDHSDFITLEDDKVMLSDTDMICTLRIWMAQIFRLSYDRG